jgi:hypothetical protein
MIEETTEEILNAVKELIAHDSTISSLKILIEKKLKDVYQDGYNEAEAQKAIDEAGEDY